MKQKLLHFFHQKKTLWQDPKKRIILIIVVFVLGIFSYRIAQGIFSGNGDTQQKKNKEVTVQSVKELAVKSQTIQATGVVESVDQVELKSEVSAKISKINVTLGQQIKHGQTIATFYNKDVYASRQDASARVLASQATLDQFQATLDAQESRLKELQKGPRKEELAISQTAVTNAQLSLNEANNNVAIIQDKVQEDLDTTLSSSVSVLRQSVQTAVDTLYNASNIQYSYFVGSTQEASSIKLAKEKAIRILLGQANAGDWLTQYIAELNGGIKGYLDSIAFSPTVDTVLDREGEVLLGIQATMELYNSIPLVEKMSDSDIALIATEKARLQSAFTAAMAAVNAIETEVTTNKSSIQNANTALVNAQNALETTQKQLQLVQAGASQEQIDAQVSAVKQAQANVRAQQAQLLSARASVSLASAQVDKTIIKSPISGRIATLPIRRDELVSPGSVIASVINNNALQIKTFIDSSQLPIVSVNQEARINNVATGTISFISPAIDPTTGKVEIIIVVDNSVETPLVVGQYVDVTITSTNTDIQAIQAVLPLQSVYITENGTYVFTVNNEHIVEQHDVVLGRVRGKEVEIIQGLENITDIIPSVRDLEAGMKVTVK